MIKGKFNYEDDCNYQENICMKCERNSIVGFLDNSKCKN